MLNTLTSIGIILLYKDLFMKHYSKKAKHLHSYNFDWDDNIMFMPTKIVIFHKTTGEELALSTHDFALHRKDVGIQGKFMDYQILNDEKQNPRFSFREFRDGANHDTNVFLPQVVEALNDPNCFGPSFKAFQEALSSPETARHTTIITARGHNPESLLEALAYLKSKGYIKHLPPLENIYPVSSPKINANAAHPSEMKLLVLSAIIDRLNEIGKNNPTCPIFSGFSDDDFGTYQTVKNKLFEFAQANRWPHVNVVLYFTGKNPEALRLTPNGYVPFTEDSILSQVA